MSQITWSFSKLSTFHNCWYEWYLTYVLHMKGKDGIYAVMGTTIHECLEEMFKGNMTIDEAKEKWLDEWDLSEFMGLEFPTEKSKNNYKKAMLHCIDNYGFYPKEGYRYMTELGFTFEPVEDIMMRGYIDLVEIDDVNKTVRTIDYKTSSKFSKKELMGHKVFQLILYSMYLEELFPDYKVLNPMFLMLKYTRNERGTMIDRSTIDEEFDNNKYEDCFVEVNYNQDIKDKLIEYVESTVTTILLKNFDDEKEWYPETTNTFFCKNLCQHYEYCQFAKK